MKKWMKRILLLLCAVLCLELLPVSAYAEEADDHVSAQNEASKVQSESFSFECHEQTGYVGYDRVVSYTGSDENITMVSSDPSVVSVEYEDDPGWWLITFNKLGTAVISAKQNGTIVDTCTVTVVEMETVYLDKPFTVTVQPNDQLLFEFYAETDGNFEYFSFYSEDSSIELNINEDCDHCSDPYFGRGEDTAEIRGKTVMCVWNWSDQVETATLCVKKTVEPQGVIFEQEHYEGYPGDSFPIRASLYPVWSIPEEPTFTSSNEKVAYYDSPESRWITLAEVGTTTITATLENGITSQCTVTVLPEPPEPSEPPTPPEPEWTTDYNFETFEELVELAAGTYDEPVYFYYCGDSSLIISEDLSMPANTNLTVTGWPVIINKGVTFTTIGGGFENYETIELLEVYGTYNLNRGLGNVNSLKVEGKINLNSIISLNPDAVLIGLDNIVKTGWGYVEYVHYVYSFDQMLNALEKAATNENGLEHYIGAFFENDCTFNKGFTITSNVALSLQGNKVCTIPAGVTVKNNGVLYIYSDMLIDGVLNNTNEIDILGWRDNENRPLSITGSGSILGKGSILIDKDNLTAYTDVITGLNLDDFEVAYEDEYCWILLKNPDQTKIDAPTVKVSNVASTGKIKLSWNKVDGAAKYQVYRATSKNGTYSLLKTTTGTSLTNTSAEAGKTYYYKVRAVDADGNKSDFSSIVSRTCDLPRPEVKVSNVSSSGKVKLTWTAVEGAVKYEVYRATSKNGTYSLLKTLTGTSLTNTSTTAGKTYYYKVRAIHSASAANSAYSEVVSRTCDLPRPEVTVTNVASTGKIKLTWKKIDGATKYEVYRATSKNGTYTKITTVTGTSLTNTSTTAGKTYYYKVRAIHEKSAANSAYSSVVSRTCDLARPTLTVKRNSNGDPKLSWDKVSGAEKYQVYVATSKNGTYKLLKTTTGTSLTHGSSVPGTTYYYKVRAIHSNSAANSAYSAIKYCTAK